MSDPKEAIHAIRNDLTPILWFAQLAQAGDVKAQKLVIKELVSRSESIHEELDILTRAIRAQRALPIAAPLPPPQPPQPPQPLPVETADPAAPGFPPMPFAA